MIRSLAQGETLPQGSVLLGELRDVGSEVIYCLLVDCLLDLEAVDIFDLVGEESVGRGEVEVAPPELLDLSEKEETARALLLCQLQLPF